MPRAVLYARCSTEEESQKDALANQVAEGKDCIEQMGWLLVDVYVESRSGTTTKGRSEYNRLFDDLSIDKFDIVVIKSQDRLMRNVKDWYLFVDRLTTENKRLYMYIERKFYTTDDALITGIKAILAEEYSRELSKKINNAHRNRQKNNGNIIITQNAYGFRKLADKSVVLEEEEADIKRRMYELCAAGFGARVISAILQKDGIYNRNGKPFDPTTILRILHNPINMGTVVMNQKHYDFESKKTICVPKEEQFVYKNKVPATVSEELWKSANQKIAERVSEKNQKNSTERIGKNKGKIQLSGKIYCGICMAPYYRRTRRKYKTKEKVCFWVCKKYLETGKNEGCDNVHLDEEILYDFLQKIAQESYVVDKENIIQEMLTRLKKVLEDDTQVEVYKEYGKKEQIEKKLNVLVDKLLAGVLTDEIFQVKQKELMMKLNDTKCRIEDLEQRNVKKCLEEDRISYVERTMREGDVIEKAIVDCMLDEVEKILVYPKYLEICFCSSKIPRKKNVLYTEFENTFDYLGKKREERSNIMEIMRENPYITAKMIAEKLGISLSGANYRIKVLKREGKITYKGKGGHGIWIVCEDEEVQDE